MQKSKAVAAVMVVMVAATTPPVPSLSPEWEGVVKLFSDPVSPEVVAPYQFVFDSPLLRVSRELADYARESFSARTPLLVAVADLNEADAIATSAARLLLPSSILIATPRPCSGSAAQNTPSAPTLQNTRWPSRAITRVSKRPLPATKKGAAATAWQ